MVYTFKSGLHVVRSKPALINILTIGLILGLYSEGYDRLWAAHLLENITLPTIGGLQPVVWFGIIRAVGMLLGLGVTEVTRRRVDTGKHGPVARAVLLLISGMVAGLLTFALTGNFIIAVLALWELLVAAADGGAVVYHVGQSARGVERARDGDLDVEPDRCAGADPRRTDCGRHRFGAGHSRLVDDLRRGAGDGAAVVDQDDQDRSADGSCHPHAGSRRSGRC